MPMQVSRLRASPLGPYFRRGGRPHPPRDAPDARSIARLWVPIIGDDLQCGRARLPRRGRPPVLPVRMADSEFDRVCMVTARTEHLAGRFGAIRMTVKVHHSKHWRPQSQRP
jgi:hypothetical protein